MTIFIDASAVVALIAGEQGADGLSRRLDEDEDRLISPLARWEAVIALHRSHDYNWRYAQASVDALIELKGIRTVSIGEPEGQYALSVYGNYGKGRHPAKLNMGDCFAFACACLNNARLLCKGDDFAQTDLAWPPDA